MSSFGTLAALPAAADEALAVGSPRVAARERSGRESRRLEPWLLLALALHLLLAVLGEGPPELRLAPGSSAIDAPAEVEVEVLAVVEPEPGEPGGGSLDPDPEGPAVAGALIATPERRWAPVVSAPERDEPGPVAPPARTTTEPEQVNDEQSPLDAAPVLAAPDADQAFALTEASRVRTARVSTLAPRPPSEPAVGAAPHTARGRHLGYGPGAYGGPGGTGRGFRSPAAGSGSPATAAGNPFGGQRGVWRGEICWVPPGTQAIRTIRECPRVGELRTDEIDISARRFDEGFPGVGERNEWFAIKYTGSFRVTETGEHRFRLHADDGAILVVDGVDVVDNDGVHEPRSEYGTIHLEAGEHRFELVYFQGPRFDLALQLFIKPPGKRERVFRPVN